MTLNLKSGLLSAATGLSVGFVWEGFGALYLWTLAEPQLLVFGLAMIAWPVLGLIMAAILSKIEENAPRHKVFLKPLAAPLALIAAKITNSAGLVSYPPSGIALFGVPWYMMTGWLILVYLLDFIVIRRMRLPLRL